MGLVSNAFSFRHTHVESNVDYLHAVSVQAAEEPRMENCLPNPSHPSEEEIRAVRNAILNLRAVIDETTTDIKERRHNLVALNDKVSLLKKVLVSERHRRERVEHYIKNWRPIAPTWTEEQLLNNEFGGKCSGSSEESSSGPPSAPAPPGRGPE
jgi:hypothetical protein